MSKLLNSPFFFRRSLVVWVVGMTTAAGFGRVDLDGFGWGAVLLIVLGGYFGKEINLTGMVQASRLTRVGNPPSRGGGEQPAP